MESRFDREQNLHPGEVHAHDYEYEYDYEYLYEHEDVQEYENHEVGSLSNQ